MRACVIFNPSAKGNRARRHLKHIKVLSNDCDLLQTEAPNHARELALKAVDDGYDTIIAGGGDGTVNEVFDGMASHPSGFERARFAVMPIGTVNVFGKELRMPHNVPGAWKVIKAGKERRIDAGRAEFTKSGKLERRHFIQMAGCGVDCTTIQLVDWGLKKKVGPFAYVWAGIRAMQQPQLSITLKNESGLPSFCQVLIGNGKYYGGPFRVFYQADMADGLLDVLMVEKFSWFTAFKAALTLPFAQHHRLKGVHYLQRASIEIEGAPGTALELEGELVGELPAKITVLPGFARIVVP